MFNSLGPEGAVAIAPALEKMTNLQFLQYVELPIFIAINVHTYLATHAVSCY